MKRKSLLILILLLCLPWFAKAQDTLTVMQYNLLQYGNYNSQYADCYETNNNTQQKDESIRTILNHVKPDIFTVCEFGSKDALQTDFLRHNLNINGVTYWKSDKLYYSSGSNICNTIFFDSRKIGLSRHVTINTSPRLTDVFELYLRTPGLAYGDTVRLVCIVAHPKAGKSEEASRWTQMQKTMDYLNQYYPNDNSLIMGDFNMYRASESGYKLLTQTYSNPDICFIDPLYSVGGVGEWNENSQYAQFHTQSTLYWTDSDCHTGGGLDDRFDFILMADEIAFGYNRLRYVQNSYKAVGNDGKHFNRDIDFNGNSSVPSDVLQALIDVSDHLPVTMKIYTDLRLGLDDSEMPSLDASVSPNPASENASVRFFNPSQGLVQFDLYSLQGQLITQGTNHYDSGSQQYELSLQGLTKGFYLLRIRHEKGWGQTMKLLVH